LNIAAAIVARLVKHRPACSSSIVGAASWMGHHLCICSLNTLFRIKTQSPMDKPTSK
jgi:hypothetical protein